MAPKGEPDTQLNALPVSLILFFWPAFPKNLVTMLPAALLVAAT
jgi:hypothetical protein